MLIRFAYGADAIPVDVPDNWINGRCYRAAGLKKATDSHAELLASLDALPATANVAALSQGKQTCVIAVDPAAPSVVRELLPALIEYLEDHSSLTRRDITILFANRPWNPWRLDEVAALMDEATRSHYHIVLHNPMDPAGSSMLGTSTKGVPITVNKHYVQADLKIILGAVTADLFCGFTGGRAVIAPGLASWTTIRQLYSSSNVDMPGVRYGNFRDNPFHVHAMESAQAAGCTLCVSACLSQEGDIARIFAGHFGQSHFQAMTTVRDSMTANVKEPMDIVITSGGGEPFDSTLLNLVHTLSAVTPVLKDEGTIVCVADLPGGIGPSDFRSMIDSSRNYDELLRIFSRQTTMIPGQWYAQMLHRILHRYEVILFNKSLGEDVIWGAGMTPSNGQLLDAIHAAMESHGQRCKIVALPDGPNCVGALPSVPSKPT